MKMRVVDSFAMLTIMIAAGMLSSSTIATVQPEIPASRLSDGIAKTVILALKANEVVNEFKEDCKKYGENDRAYDDFQNNVEKLTAALIPVGKAIYTKIFKQSAAAGQNAFAKAAITTVLTDICPALPSMSVSLKNVVNSYKNCLEQKNRNHIDKDGGVELPMLEYACENHGQHILEIFGISGMSCIKFAAPVIKDCIRHSPGLIDYVRENGGKMFSNFMHFDMNLKNCQVIERVRHCVVESLNECENSKLGIIADSLIRIFKKHTTCQKLLKNKS